MTVVIIAVIVGLLGVGLAASQLMRLRRWLNASPAVDEQPNGHEVD